MERSHFLSLIPKEQQYDPEDWDSFAEYVHDAFFEAWNLDETTPETHAALKHVVHMLLFTKEEWETFHGETPPAKYHEVMWRLLVNALRENGWEDAWE